jgi:chemotaxis protein histidine kinase CheA
MNQVQERINELRQRYMRTLPDRVATIGGMLMHSTRAELLRQFHTLAGTAGTFGYDDVAVLAGEAERTLSGAGPATAVTRAEIQDVAFCLADLDHAIQQHLCGGVA